jgi:isoaspartyl peptidase/L-asparaginase-like protein (Ntn-hydrolase superfamily)
MELDDVFDAGKGSFLNAKAEVELDAIICDGKVYTSPCVSEESTWSLYLVHVRSTWS